MYVGQLEHPGHLKPRLIDRARTVATSQVDDHVELARTVTEIYKMNVKVEDDCLFCKSVARLHDVHVRM